MRTSKPQISPLSQACKEFFTVGTGTEEEKVVFARIVEHAQTEDDFAEVNAMLLSVGDVVFRRDLIRQLFDKADALKIKIY